MSKIVASNQLDWQKHLSEIQFAHNTTFHESIATTPYKVVFKEDLRTIVHAAADVIHRPQPAGISKTPLEFATDRDSGISRLCSRVKTNSERMAVQRRKGYNKSNLVFHQCQCGELVWIRNKTGERKVSRPLSLRWIGQYAVVRPICDVV